MDADWLGKTVSLDCGHLGYFQGLIQSIQIEEQTITITNAFQNGVPVQKETVTLRGQDINDLKFLENTKNPEAKSVVQVKKRTKTVSENATTSTKSGFTNYQSSNSPVMGNARKGNNPDSLLTFNSRECQRTPSSRLSRKDEDCFGNEIYKEDFSQEFDFEKNLALFDKRLVFEEIDASQPDVVRLVDINRKKPSPVFIGENNEPKYRNDQNVINSKPVNYRQIQTNQKAEGEYVTDAGLVVPCIDLSLRNRLMASAEAKGFSNERITELVARAGAELSIQLLGGERRLNPSNSHQFPLAVILSGPGKSGSYGLAIGRHLSSLGIRTVAYLPELSVYQSHLATELSLYKLCCKGNSKVSTLIHSVEELPKGTPIDLIVLALSDHDMYQQECKQDWYKAASKWALSSRAPILAVDPVQMNASHIKASILPGLPLWHPHNSVGRVYLVNLGLPTKVFKDVGITYTSPFGAKTFIGLSST